MVKKAVKKSRAAAGRSVTRRKRAKTAGRERAKTKPAVAPARALEAERLVLPGTRGANRIRLLVRAPEWMFAYWYVDPEAMRDLGKHVGERSLGLSRLTLRIVDPASGAASDILLPLGARWWYVRTDGARREYRAELGVTLPSGHFRRLAASERVFVARGREGV